MYQCKNLGCNQEFKFTMQLARHKSKCSKPEVDKKHFTVELGFQFGKCKKAFSDQLNVSRHVKNYQVKKPQTGHKCKKCDKVFRFGSELKRHLQSHTNTENKKCNCGRKFKRSDYFTEHLATCNENLMESTADFVPSFVQAHKEHLNDHEEQTNSDTTINVEPPAGPIMPVLEESEISPEETFDGNIDLDNAPINSNLNPNAELEKSS